MWVYLLPNQDRAGAVQDAAYLRAWFESLGTDATCGIIELPVKDRARNVAYTPGWYAYTLADPRVARRERDSARMKQREATNTQLTELEAANEAAIEEEELCEQRESVTFYLIGEAADRRNQFEDVLRQLRPTYDDSWVAEDFEDFDE